MSNKKELSTPTSIEQEKVSPEDWSKLLLADRDVQIFEARLQNAKTYLQLLQKELVIAYQIGPTDKVNQDGTITRGPKVEKLA